ncbi:hypothetical protein P9209_15460 [Prescottella defluvii]|nr:hypothetical protein P9209_15460 [Prescottella defluvii]
MNSSGAITALRLRPDPEAQNKARSMIEQAFYQAVYRMVAFPVEPIGVGAVWKIHQQVMSAIALDQVTTATLSARDGDRLTVDVQVEQFPKSPYSSCRTGRARSTSIRTRCAGAAPSSSTSGRRSRSTVPSPSRAPSRSAIRGRDAAAADHR